jgi:hypothetical protein
VEDAFGVLIFNDAQLVKFAAEMEGTWHLAKALVRAL